MLPDIYFFQSWSSLYIVCVLKLYNTHNKFWERFYNIQPFRQQLLQNFRSAEYNSIPERLVIENDLLTLINDWKQLSYYYQQFSVGSGCYCDVLDLVFKHTVCCIIVCTVRACVSHRVKVVTVPPNILPSGDDVFILNL